MDNNMLFGKLPTGNSSENGPDRIPPESFPPGIPDEVREALEGILKGILPEGVSFEMITSLSIQLDEIRDRLGKEANDHMRSFYGEKGPDGSCRVCGTTERVCRVHGVCASCHVVHFRDMILDEQDAYAFLLNILIASYTDRDGPHDTTVVFALDALTDVSKFYQRVNEHADRRIENIEEGGGDIELPPDLDTFF